MQKRLWAQEALEKLQAGQTAQANPRGHSMRGRVNDGDRVTLEPCRAEDLEVGDVVLARVAGRRYSHLVLHLVLACEPDRILIGNNFGRVDGWVAAENIFGKATRIELAEAPPHTT